MKWWPYLFIIVLGIWAVRALFAPEFFTSHDGPAHISRLAQYITLLGDGQFPPRWSATLNGKLGYPLFVYSYHIPYLAGSLFYQLGAKLFQSVELVLGLSYVVSGIGMYFLLAPYRFSLIFVRAAIGEATAIAFLPFILWAVTKYARTKGRKFLTLAAVFIAGAITSHSLFMVMYLPIIALFTFILLLPDLKHLKTGLWRMGLIIGLGMMLSAFYWAPLVWERKYIQFDAVYTKQAQNHLVTWEQLWHSPWGYGFSFPDSHQDDMSFQIGLAQLLAVGLGTLILWGRRHKQDHERWVMTVSLLIFTFSVVTMVETPIVRWVWENVGVIQVIDFPWRFLGMVTFAAAIIAAYTTSKLKPAPIAAIILITAALVANRNHMRINLPDKIAEDKVWIDTGTTAYANEYKPIWQAAPQKVDPILQIESEGPSTNWQLLRFRSNEIEFWTNFPEPQIVQINSLYFPGWQAYRKEWSKWIPLTLGGEWRIVTAEAYKGRLDKNIGVMEITAQPGEQVYKLTFSETPLRQAADILSLAALVGLLVWVRRQKPLPHTGGKDKSRNR